MLKFKAFCLDYWQFLCLQPLHGVYKRYVDLWGGPRRWALGLWGIVHPTPAEVASASGYRLPATGQEEQQRLLQVTLQRSLIVLSSSCSPEPGRISAEKWSPRVLCGQELCSIVPWGWDGPCSSFAPEQV